MGLGKTLTICSECKKIKIDENNELWLVESVDPLLYNDILKKYEGKLSHTLCSKECGKPYEVN